MTEEKRPSLTTNLTGAELLRWYWLKEELSDLAGRLGIRATGSKELLTRRIVASLDGVVFVEPRVAARTNGPQLSGPLEPSTLIPVGQRCSQAVRAWFVTQVGSGFGFDAAMRAFFADVDGTQTMQDALVHYRATRGAAPKAIGAQFEYNRFTRAWHETHPAGNQDELHAAWQRYRERPVDERGRA